MKRIFQPSALRHDRLHDFRTHMANKNGCQVLARCHAKGRSHLIAPK